MKMLLILCLFSANIAFAQDSTRIEKKGVISTIRQKLNRTQSISATDLVDSLKSKLISKTDTLKFKQPDSLRRTVKSDSLAKPSLKDKAKQVEDSIKNLANYHPGAKSNILVSVKSKSDSLSQRIASVDDSLNSKINNASSKLKGAVKPVEGNEEVNAVTEKLGIDDKIPGSNKLNEVTGDLKLPDANIPGVNLDDVAPVGVSLQTKDINKPEMPSGPDLKSPDLKDQPNILEEVKEKANVDLPGSDKLNELNEKTSQVDSKLQVAEKYEGEVNKVKEGDLSSVDDAAKKAEDKATDVSGMSDATEKVGKLTEQQEKLKKQQDEYLAMVQKYRDKKIEHEEILRKSKNIANDKLNKFSPAVIEGQKKLAEIKKAKAGVGSLKAFLKKENVMKSKPFYERLVPGISLQAYKVNVYSLDFAPQIGFKASGRFTFGAGGIYRLGISEKFKRYAQGVGVYGYRVYSDINLLKGIYAHGELEKHLLDKFTAPQFNIEQQPDKLTNFHIGLGKRYAISKKIYGNLLVLYRAELKGHMPSMSKINLRVGFDLNTKKRKKLPGL